MLACPLAGFLVAFTLIISVNAHAGHEHENTGTTVKSDGYNKIQKKWGVQDFIRDTDHVKEDLETVIELSGKGELSQEETLFYMFRMHDFDDNAKLDGLEIMAVIKHASMTNMTQEELTAGVDNVLEMDDDNDGFLSYPEMKNSLKPKTAPTEPNITS